MNIEQQIDVVLAQQQAAQDGEARTQLRYQLIEQQRLQRLGEENARQAAARAAYLERVRATYEPACTRYKRAVDEFRAARVQLQALDLILDRSGFGLHSIGIELRHAGAAPDEGDIHAGLPAAVDSIRKDLGG
jgi:hypothetical protein